MNSEELPAENFLPVALRSHEGHPLRSSTSKSHLEPEIVEGAHLEVERPQRDLQVVPVRVRAVPLLQVEPWVEVHVVEHVGHAAAHVVHVVDLAVLLHGHPGHVGGEGGEAGHGRRGGAGVGGAGGLAEAPGVG